MGENGERIHKVLAMAGYGSRRACEDLITQGRVRVDGRVVTELGTRVDVEAQELRLDDEVVKPEPLVYYLAYKPAGLKTTTRDPFHKRTVIDLVRQRVPRRIFPVGRMAEDSEGLVILTNDGRLAHELVGHRNRLVHTWFVKVRGAATPEVLERLRKGLWLSDGRTAPLDVQVQRPGKHVTSLRITPLAPEPRPLRRLLAKVELHVVQELRVRIGPLTTHALAMGAARRLTEQEVELLRRPRPEDLVTGRAARLREPAPVGPGKARGPKGPGQRPGGGGRGKPGARGGASGRGSGRRKPAAGKGGRPSSGGGTRGRRVLGP